MHDSATAARYAGYELAGYLALSLRRRELLHRALNRLITYENSPLPQPGGAPG
jgi:hypothetical protein